MSVRAATIRGNGWICRGRERELAGSARPAELRADRAGTDAAERSVDHLRAVRGTVLRPVLLWRPWGGGRGGGGEQQVPSRDAPDVEAGQETPARRRMEQARPRLAEL